MTYGPSAHGDLANAAAGALVEALARPRYWGFEEAEPSITQEPTLRELPFFDPPRGVCG